jgi:hypothetical protein
MFPPKELPGSDLVGPRFLFCVNIVQPNTTGGSRIMEDDA